MSLKKTKVRMIKPKILIKSLMSKLKGSWVLNKKILANA